MTTEQLRKIHKEIKSNNKRYYMYDYLMGTVALVDSENDNIVMFQNDVKGRVINIVTNKIDGKIKYGLKRRLNGKYGLHNSKVMDSYIYYHLFNHEEQNECGYKPTISGYDYIGSSNSLLKSLQTVIEYVYNYENNNHKLTKEEKIEYENTKNDMVDNFIKNYK